MSELAAAKTLNLKPFLKGVLIGNKYVQQLSDKLCTTQSGVKKQRSLL